MLIKLFSLINKIVGSITHWTFRLLINLICDKCGLYIDPHLKYKIAYLLTWLFLFGIGFWSYWRFGPLRINF